MGSAVVPGLLELIREHRTIGGGVLFFAGLIPGMVLLWKLSEEWKR